MQTTIHLKRQGVSDNSLESRDCQGVWWALQVKGHKDDMRGHIQCVAVKGGEFFKTDGSRMHRYTPFGKYKDGLYRIATNKKNEVCLVPDTSGASFPECHFLFKPENEDDTLAVSNSTRYGDYANIIRATPKETTLNYDFFEQVLSSGDVFEVTALPTEEKQGPAFFQNGRKMALLMPMRIK